QRELDLAEGGVRALVVTPCLAHQEIRLVGLGVDVLVRHGALRCCPVRSVARNPAARHYPPPRRPGGTGPAPPGRLSPGRSRPGTPPLPPGRPPPGSGRGGATATGPGRTPYRAR